MSGRVGSAVAVTPCYAPGNTPSGKHASVTTHTKQACIIMVPTVLLPKKKALRTIHGNNTLLTVTDDQPCP